MDKEQYARDEMKLHWLLALDSVWLIAAITIVGMTALATAGVIGWGATLTSGISFFIYALGHVRGSIAYDELIEESVEYHDEQQG